MTADKYKAFLERHGLRQVDASWLCGQSERQGRYWAEKGVPPAASLLLQAFDDGLIPLTWFRDKISRPIP
jgi:hypothetical protein